MPSGCSPKIFLYKLLALFVQIFSFIYTLIQLLGAFLKQLLKLRMNYDTWCSIDNRVNSLDSYNQIKSSLMSKSFISKMHDDLAKEHFLANLLIGQNSVRTQAYLLFFLNHIHISDYTIFLTHNCLDKYQVFVLHV